MLIVNSVLGNVHHEKTVKEKTEQAKSNGTLKKLFLTRSEMEKSRLQKTTEDGLELGFVFEPGKTLHTGDVLNANSDTIMIHQLPEKVLHVRVKEENNPTLLVQVGHIIGNRHRPISISDDGTIVFPIHIDGELDLFKELFHDIVDHLELQVSEEIFTSNKGMNSHEH